MTTPVQSSRAPGLRTNAPSSISMPLNTTSTAEPSTASTEPMLDSTPGHPPHLNVNQPSVNFPNLKTCFTFHRILSVVILVSLFLPKFIETYRGNPLTIGRLDFILAILQLILYVCSWWEDKPPVYMRWLLDTDWGYLLDISRQSAVKVKRNFLAICCTLSLVLSILLFITGTIRLAQSVQVRLPHDIFFILVILHSVSLIVGTSVN
ncbi:hypothetical protein V8E55_007630 [Tylopilus felleus]